jgi:hypothetical protein
MNFKESKNLDDLVKQAALEEVKSKYPESFTKMEDLPYKARDKYVWSLFHHLKLKDEDGSITSNEKSLYKELINYINKYFGSSYLQEES